MSRIAFSEWGYREYEQALSGILWGRKPEARDEMCGRFSAVLSNRPLLALNRASTGLCLALQSFSALHPDRREVIVPAYICPIVMDTIRYCGLRAIPADIGDDLNLDLERLKQSMSPSTLAVVAAHMYGCAASIQEMEWLCRERGVFLVDDAAQALGVSVNGRPLGTFGDVGMISFSQSKPIAVGTRNAGGLMVINNPELEPLLRGAWQRLPETRHAWADILRFLWLFKWESWTEAPSHWFGKLFSVQDTLDGLALAKISGISASIAEAQLESLPQRIGGRIRIAALFQRALAGQDRAKFLQFAPGRFLTRIVLSLPAPVDRNAVRNRLRNAGIRPRLGYPMYREDAVIPPTKAMALQPTLIELPSHSKMTEAEIGRMVESLDAALKL